MAKADTDELMPFTARLRPDELGIMMAFIATLSKENNGRRVSYSRAIAEMLRALPADRLDPDTLKAVRKKSKAKRKRAR